MSGQHLIDARIEACERLLLQAAREGALVLTGDQRCSEPDAAALLCMAPEYLKALRHEGKGPPAYELGMAGKRVTYRIGDLAAWIESRRLDWTT